MTKKEENNLEKVRHSLAHLLAAAVLDIYPEAKLAIGPAIENGFYYDIDFGDEKPGEEDLPKIEKRMKKLLPSWETFEKIDVGANEARQIFKGNPYKLELIDELEEKKEPITIYYSGPDGAPSKEDILDTKYQIPNAGFLDLCRGGHVESPAGDINPDAFKLSHLAGAYWRGDEGNPQLTRIYGLAFETKKDLEAYILQQEEAKKRDHRKLGRELDLFFFSDLVGAGLPLFTPKGTLIRDLLDSFVWELREKRGYQRVDIAHITKKELYEISGHWDKFADELFHIKTREGHEFVVKPMNCPHHTQIFARKPHSYREMPQRYANTTKVYRDEQTGELSGLTRVRSITQDDAHVFCRYSQAKDEISVIWDIVEEFYGAFAMSTEVTLSLHDPEAPEKYLGTKDVWEKAENDLRDLAKERGVNPEEFVGEAAFYGPKIDFIAKDSLGRRHQVATIQFDMNMPENFDLYCIDEEGKEERIVMLHAAIMGSVERFMGPLIEHYAGAFPLWLSPTQIKILPIGEGHKKYGQEILEVLESAGIRAELDDSDETLGKKIRNWKLEKVPYAVVVGDKEVESQKITPESRDDEAKGDPISPQELLEKLKTEIRDKK